MATDKASSSRNDDLHSIIILRSRLSRAKLSCHSAVELPERTLWLRLWRLADFDQFTTSTSRNTEICRMYPFPSLRCSVVTPCYNEALNVHEIHRRVRSVFDRLNVYEIRAYLHRQRLR